MAEKRAIQRVVRDVNGGLRTIYVDLDTFLEVPANALDQYRIVNTTPPPPEEVSDVNSPNEDAPSTSPGDSLDLERSQGERPNDRRQSTAQRVTQRENPQGAPVGKVSRGPLGPATPSTDISRNPQDTQRSNTSENTSGNNTTRNTDPASDDNLGGGGVSYANIGPNRPHPVDPSVEAALGGLANRTTPGNIASIVSGDVNPSDAGWSAKGGKYSKSHRHTDELGADWKSVDPATGKAVSDPVAIGDAMMNAAALNPSVGLGFGNDYMGPETIHTDFTGKAGIWGDGIGPRTAAGDSGSIADNVAFARQTGIGATPYSNAPTPTPSPGNIDEGFVSQDDRVLDRSGTPNKTGPVNISTDAPTSYSTPAQMAAQGLISRTPAELGAIAMTFAGELGTDTLKGLAANDPLARTEFANMLTSLENRAQSKTYKSIADALRPSQYNSLMQEKLPTTYDNYEKFGGIISSVMNDFYTGALQPTSWDITSYYNPSVVTPSWASAMENPTMVTEHLFGSLPEYSPNTAFRSSNALMSNPRPDNTFGSTGTPESNHSLERERDNSLAGRASGSRSSGVSNSMGTPGSSPGGGWSSQGEGGRGGTSGGGYSGNSGSQDSPGESGGRHGGSGLGSPSDSGSASSGSKSSGTPGSSPGGGWGSQQSAHDAERERDNSL